jgi:hypothetical protein
MVSCLGNLLIGRIRIKDLEDASVAAVQAVLHRIGDQKNCTYKWPRVTYYKASHPSSWQFAIC